MSIETVKVKLAALRRAGMVSLAIAMIMALGMGWYFNRSIFRPLSSLQNALRMVDKLVGNMILAVFGHPLPLEQEQEAAPKAAKAIIICCDDLNRQAAAQSRAAACEFH